MSKIFRFCSKSMDSQALRSNDTHNSPPEGATKLKLPIASLFAEVKIFRFLHMDYSPWFSFCTQSPLLEGAVELKFSPLYVFLCPLQWHVSLVESFSASFHTSSPVLPLHQRGCRKRLYYTYLVMSLARTFLCQYIDIDVIIITSRGRSA